MWGVGKWLLVFCTEACNAEKRTFTHLKNYSIENAFAPSIEKWWEAKDFLFFWDLEILTWGIQVFKLLSFLPFWKWSVLSHLFCLQNTNHILLRFLSVVIIPVEIWFYICDHIADMCLAYSLECGIALKKSIHAV